MKHFINGWLLVKSGSADVRIWGCYVRFRTRVRVVLILGLGLRLGDGAKVTNYSLITVLPVGTELWNISFRKQQLPN